MKVTMNKHVQDVWCWEYTKDARWSWRRWPEGESESLLMLSHSGHNANVCLTPDNLVEVCLCMYMIKLSDRLAIFIDWEWKDHMDRLTHYNTTGAEKSYLLLQSHIGASFCLFPGALLGVCGIRVTDPAAAAPVPRTLGHPVRHNERPSR